MSKRLFAFFVLFSSLSLISLIGCDKGEVRDIHQGYLNLGDSVHYVGMETCKKCHQDIYRNFVRTEMGRAMRKAVLRNSQANFHDQKPVYDSVKNLYYLPFSLDSLMFVKEYRISETGDTVHERIEKVDLIVGSGHHTNSHLMVKNGYVYQMPVTFYTQKGYWDLPPGFEKGNNTRFSRYIGQECMTCHNGYANFRAGSRNRFFDIPEGIDCERCHGPGEIHVQEKSKGITVNVQEEIDYTIVNPAKLSSELQMDLCQRCHLQGISSLNKGRNYTDFKPGMHLNEMYELYQARFEDSESSFIMAAHPDRLRMSNCYLKSRESSEIEDLTCITCHNPHYSVNDFDDNYFNDRCFQCHDNGVKSCSEDLKVTDSKNNNCILCHMQRSSSYDIPHVSITDHYIRKQPKSRPVDKADVAKFDWEKQKSFLKLVCLTSDNPSPYNSALAYLNYFEKYAANPILLDSARKYLDKIDEPVLEIRYLHLKGDYKILVNKYGGKRFADAWTSYRIGKAYENSGDIKEAENYYKQAVEQAPENIDFQNELASILMVGEKNTEAFNVLMNALSLNDNFSKTHNLMGYNLVLAGKMDEAEKYFLRAHKLDPDAIKPIENLFSLYLNVGEKQKALYFVNELLKRYPENTEYIRLKNLTRLL